MKRILAITFLLAVAAGCTSVERIVPLIYPEGNIPDPTEPLVPVRESHFDLPASRPDNSRWGARETEDAVKHCGSLAQLLTAEDIKLLRHDHACLVRFPDLENREYFIEAYNEVLARGMPVLITTDLAADRYFGLVHYLHSQLESRYIEPNLKRMLRDMIRTSLEQYHYATGKVKEAAWRNVAYLSVAVRLLDPEASTPFITSGIVRQELDKIQDARGEGISPLFSLESGVPSGPSTRKTGHFDYAIFVHHPFISGSPDHCRLHQALLWLSEPDLPLGQPYPFLQAILLTDCLKRTQTLVGDRQTPASTVWYATTRFYGYFHRMQSDINFAQVDAFLRETLPENYDERFFLDSARLTKMEENSNQTAAFRKRTFNFFPSWDEPYAGFFTPLVYPEVGPDVSDPLYHSLLLTNLIPACAPSSAYRLERNRLRTGQLERDDFPFLFCCAEALAHPHPEVMEMFRLQPSATDMLRLAGWRWPDGKSPRSFVHLNSNFSAMHNRLTRRDFSTWSQNLPDATILTAFRLNPELSPGQANAPKEEASATKARQSALGLLTQLQPPPSSKKEPFPATGPLPTNPDQIRLEAAPHFYNRLRDMTDQIRKYLMMMGFSSLELDDILIRYENLAERMRDIALACLAGGEISPELSAEIVVLLEGFQTLERRLTAYFDQKDMGIPLQPFPRYLPLFQSRYDRTQLIGIYDNFHLLVIGVRTTEGIRLYVAPQPVYHELIAAGGRIFQPEEIRDSVRRGLAHPVGFTASN